jgi:hypothetical protein
MKILYTTVVVKREGKSTLGRPRHRWENNIQIGIKETGYEVVDRTDLAQDIVQWNTVMNLWMPLQAENVLTS